MKTTLRIIHAVLNGTRVNISIADNTFAKIEPEAESGVANLQSEDTSVPVLDAEGMWIVPAFYNAHTHAAMSLLRGYADDMELFTWLNEYIWPVEGTLTPRQIYEGTRLAILEMIHSGTVFFNDMYWNPEITLRAVEEMGVRAALGRLFIEESPGKILEKNLCSSRALESAYRGSSARDRIQLTYAPHAIYSVSGITLSRVAEMAKETGEMIHIHASETSKEVEDCAKEHGMSPIAWLDTCGLLTSRTVLAHCVHLSTRDVAILRDRGAIACSCPWSNAKLCSGQFNYRQVVEEYRCRVALGTDGCASNNNLSMFDEMKAFSLLAKARSGDPKCAPAASVLHIATKHGAEAFGIHAGVIAEGWLADCLLVNPASLPLVPMHHLEANLVYSADTSCVDTVICNGRVLMRHGVIPGEGDIIEAARSAAVFPKSNQ
ncbi:MAG: amidohydrolase [Kiritimatiellae bacterium]|nr:amidohydrolase [Kiritimatiellia bacterium]